MSNLPTSDSSSTSTTLETPREPVVKGAWYLIKDAKGYGSVSVTLVMIAFWLVSFAYLTSVIDHIGPIKFKTFDVAAATAYFTPILAVYFGRRWTDAKYFSSDAPK